VSKSRGVSLEHAEETQGSVAFGAYLKKLRETRRLSLDAVEELSATFPDKVTKSHLSRIENGLALPNFPRLMAMSHIYGVPIASLAERYEIELRRSMKPAELAGKPDDVVLREFEALFYSGDFNEALILVWALTDRVRASGSPEAAAVELRLKIIVCLMKLGRYSFAKSHCEDILSNPKLPEPTRLRALQLFANACLRLQLHDVALLALDACERGAHHVGGSGRFRADVLALRGNLHQDAARPGDALAAYEKALEIYSAAGEAYEVLTVRLNMAVAETDCARLDSAKDMIEALLLVLEAGQHERLRALALSQLGLIHFRNGRLDAAEGFAIKSNTLARPREYHAIVFRNCFYLWQIAKTRSDDGAVRLNERTLRSYLARIEEPLPEVDEFRRLTAGDQS
jgi:transcriptional regulator with XRE-family HTH domain/predicted negative regulator of RcsB-dependent stress response